MKNEMKKFKILILKTSPKIGAKAVCNGYFRLGVSTNP